jgi:hypothetical protein
MPFDAVGPSTLWSIARALGIEPVSTDLFAAHKAAELAKHPGNWWYKHHHLAEATVSTFFCLCGMTTMAGVILAIFWIGSFASMLCAGIAAVSFLLLVLLVTSGILVGSLVSKAPAEWREADPDWREVPGEVSAMANRILRALPDAQVAVGTLIQETFVLDPYLVIRWEGDEVCLGIWDEGGVLYHAESSNR